MPYSSSPVLSTLHRYIQHGLQRCLSTTPDATPSQQNTSFHDWCGSPPSQQQQQSTHQSALDLKEVLEQVFQHLDGRTLCSTAVLVCQLWRQVATSETIWTARCDALLLSVVQQAVQARQSVELSSDGNSDQVLKACREGHPAARTPTDKLLEAAGSTWCQLPLPLIHHAVYGSNLLRNPLFLLVANTDGSFAWHSGSKARHQQVALLTPEQRRYAWVTTMGLPSWKQMPEADEGIRAPPPLPLQYPGSSCCTQQGGLQAQLQEWFFGRFGRPAFNANSTPEVLSRSRTAASTAAEASCRHDSSSLCRSYLATGSSWTEVVQVVDLAGELMARGLSGCQASAILDGAGLAMVLSFWAAATPHATTTPPDSSSQVGSRQQQQHHQNTAACTGSTNRSGQPSRRCSNTGSTTGATAAGSSTPPAAARRRAQDPPAQFAAALVLDNGLAPLRSFQTFVHNDSTHHFFSKRLALDPADGWLRYVYVVPCCPRGVRRAVVLLRGRGDGQATHGSAAASDATATCAGSSRSSTAAGCGGVWFACAQLSFVKQSEIGNLRAEQCMADWQDRIVQGL